MRNFLFFDTETTGLPKQYKAPMEDVNNWPRIIQLAFLVANENGEELYRYKELIKPDGWEIPKEKFWIDNGYSTEENIEKGVPIFESLRLFQAALKRSQIKVAHNIAFDNPIVGAEMIRAGVTHELFKYKRGICTMSTSTQYCQLPKPNGGWGYKWPKLEELHQKLFNCGFDGAHDAMADVTATKDCFFELVKLGLIKIDQ